MLTETSVGMIFRLFHFLHSTYILPFWHTILNSSPTNQNKWEVSTTSEKYFTGRGKLSDFIHIFAKSDKDLRIEVRLSYEIDHINAIFRYLKTINNSFYIYCDIKGVK